LGETTERLVGRASSGDADAFERLVGRYLPRLRRLAHGRLPTAARGLVDTDDLVQVTLSRCVRQAGAFEDRGRGAFHAYLRRSLLNELRNQARRARRHPAPDGLSGQEPDEGPSPLDLAVGREKLARYEAALGRLHPDEQELIIGRIELGLSHAELAAAVGKPSADAARVAVARALVHLTREMGS
jgi:RNA polymerase sigma-70 factor (ECF subfamily)